MKIIIPGNPHATKRVRCGVLNGHGHAYNDPQQTKDMAHVRSIILSQWNAYFDVPNFLDDNHLKLKKAESFIVSLQFYLPICKSENESVRNLKLWGFIPCNDKPDFDNLAKFYCDCATGIIWKDDKLITLGISHKVRYSNNPRTEMTIIPNNPSELKNHNQKIVFETFSPLELKEFYEKCLELGNEYENNKEHFEDNSTILTESFISSTAVHIMDFAHAFTDKLKKINKKT